MSVADPFRRRDGSAPRGHLALMSRPFVFPYLAQFVAATAGHRMTAAAHAVAAEIALRHDLVVAEQRRLVVAEARPDRTPCGGAAWAILLTMVIWRIYPFLPARRSHSSIPGGHHR